MTSMRKEHREKRNAEESKSTLRDCLHPNRFTPHQQSETLRFNITPNIPAHEIHISHAALTSFQSLARVWLFDCFSHFEFPLHFHLHPSVSTPRFVFLFLFLSVFLFLIAHLLLPCALSNPPLYSNIPIHYHTN
jgi:hypothetical protein